MSVIKSVEEYMRTGWSLVPIPNGSKAPVGRGWNERENGLLSPNLLPRNSGVGIRHAYSGTMALDIDHFDRSQEELLKHGMDLNELMNREDAVLIKSGRRGHGKLLYRMPEGLVLNSKKLIDTDNEGVKYNYLDFRCGTSNGLTLQDVLPPTVHPDTARPYQWGGKGDYHNLPYIPMQLLFYWQELLEADKREPISSDNNNMLVDWMEVEVCLKYISPDISRDEWISVGMALYWAGNKSGTLDKGFRLWDSWSKGSDKYKGVIDLTRSWRSFKNTGDNLITLGTLYKRGGDNGWIKSQTEVSQMFSPLKKVYDVNDEIVNLESIFTPPPPRPDINLFPQVLGRRAEEIGESVGCDPIIPLFAGLSSICGAANAQSKLELDHGYLVPPVLWLMSIGNPADKKTPGSRPMFKPLEKLEKEDRKRYAQAKMEWDVKEAVHKEKRKENVDYMKGLDVLPNDQVPVPDNLPPAPVPLRFTVNDTTSQKLVKLAVSRPEGMVCVLDEMSGWIKKIHDPRSAENKSTWTEAYESKPYVKDTVGDGTDYVDNFAISIYGNVQPKVLKRSISQMGEDGLLHRFLPAVLDSSLSRYSEALPYFMTNEREWEDLLRVVASLPALTYTLSDEAKQEFIKFRKWYDVKKGHEVTLNTDSDFMNSFGKLEGLCGRLALVFHLISDPYNIEVSKETVFNAITLIKTFIIPSYRYVFVTLMEKGGSDFDKWVTDLVLQRSDLNDIALNDIKAAAGFRFKKLDITKEVEKDEMIRSAMATLEISNWVIPEGNKKWFINPKLKHKFSDYRKRVILAKKSVMDEINANLKKRGTPPKRPLKPYGIDEILENTKRKAK